MKPLFDPYDYDNRTVMRCNTREKAKAFLSFLRDNGAKVPENYRGDIGTFWHEYKYNTCYKFMSKKSITHGHAAWYFSHGYKVIDYDDFEWDEAQTFDADSVPSFEEIL